MTVGLRTSPRCTARSSVVAPEALEARPESDVRRRRPLRLHPDEPLDRAQRRAVAGARAGAGARAWRGSAPAASASGLAPGLRYPHDQWSSAWLRAPPVSSTSAACARSSSTGSSPATRAASSACGSRTPTRAARSRRRSTRSRTRCAGSGSTGTASSRSSSTGWTTAAKSREQLVAEGKAYEDDGAIRFRMPDEGVTAWDDVVRGRVEFPNEKLEDVVLVRSDGRPTYNFASPMEDVWDGITHVIRGDDHISNTPKQINIIRAVGAELPVYAHVPSIFGAGRQEALEAPRRDRRSTSSAGRRLPARGADELPRAARLGARRRDDDHEPRRADRAVLARARQRRARRSSTTQKLDWMNGVYMRALAARGASHTALVLWLGENGYDWDAELVARDGAARAGEDREARRVSRRSQGSSSTTCSPTRRSSTGGGADARCGARGARVARAVHADGDRDGAARRRRRARPQAAPGVSADPGRGHRLEDLTRPVREHRAARPREVTLSRLRAAASRSQRASGAASVARADRGRARRGARPGAGTSRWVGNGKPATPRRSGRRGRRVLAAACPLPLQGRKRARAGSGYGRLRRSLDSRGARYRGACGACPILVVTTSRRSGFSAG